MNIIADIGGVIAGLVVVLIIGGIAAFIWMKVQAARALIKKGKQALEVARELSTPEGRKRVVEQVGEFKKKAGDLLNRKEPNEPQTGRAEEDSVYRLRHALAKAFYAVAGWDKDTNDVKPIDDKKLQTIDVALSRCDAFVGANDAQRRAVLADAAAVMRRDGGDGIGDATNVIGPQHGRQMLEIMNELVLFWGSTLPMKKHLMWHLNTMVGVSVDDYTKMWERTVAAPRKAF